MPQCQTCKREFRTPQGLGQHFAHVRRNPGLHGQGKAGAPSEYVTLRGLVEKAKVAICGATWAASDFVSREAMTVEEWEFVEEYRRHFSARSTRPPGSE